MNELVMMSHVFFGVVSLLSAVWFFVEVLNISGTNQRRIRVAGWISAIFMWVAFVVAGYWYVTSYGADKAVILKGPWPFAHSFFMEVKEHLAIILLMLATYLPIAAAGDLLVSKDARRAALWVSGLIILLALAMEGSGAVIAMGVKVGLLAR